MGVVEKIGAHTHDPKEFGHVVEKIIDGSGRIGVIIDVFHHQRDHLGKHIEANQTGVELRRVENDSKNTKVIFAEKSLNSPSVQITSEVPPSGNPRIN